MRQSLHLAKLLLPLLIFFALACTPEIPPPVNTFTGTVAGHSFTPRDAIFTIRASTSGTEALLYMADTPNLCAFFVSRRAVPGSTVLALTALRRSSESPGPGEYNVDAGGELASSGRLYPLGQNCEPLITLEEGHPESGPLLIDEIFSGPGGRMRGRFTYAFGLQLDHAEGTFNAAWCDLTGSEFPPAQGCGP